MKKQMKAIGVITDSQCAIEPKEAARLGIKVLPMPFYIDEECYYEDIDITREQFFTWLAEGKTVTTSQPSPEAVMNLWREGLEEYEEVLYMPLSSGLSGSCNTARMLAEEEEFAGRVYVVDNGRMATPLHRSLLDTLELIEEGYSAKEIKEILEDTKEEMVIYLGVETLEYLKRGGRISATAAAVGTVLNIKPILKLGTGMLEAFKKSRGMKKAKREMLEAMKHDLEVTFKDAYENNEVYLMAASSADEQTTKEWVAEIEAFFPGMKVLCDNLPLAICCHTGEGALGIGCSCKPKK